LIVVLALCPSALHAQQLETETARLLPSHVLQAGGNFEFQTSSDGHETAIPFAFEYGISNRLELMVEPVVYTSIHPAIGSAATGVGDLETTLTYLMRPESPGFPALAVAGELKIPTAKNQLIGSGQTDYAAYLIASKRVGRIDLHFNVGYTVVGNSATTTLDNIFNFAAAGVYQLGARTELFGEILANTSAAPGTSVTAIETSATPEAAAGQISGTLGLGRYVARSLLLSASVSYDNNGAVLFRPGFAFTVH
jgi:hypothetical protein